jgi:hypothetical protein
MRTRRMLIMSGAVIAAAALLRGAAGQTSLPLTMVTDKRSGPGWSTVVAYPRFGGGSPLAALANRTITTREIGGAVSFGQRSADSFKKLGQPTAHWYRDETATVSLADPALISAYFETEEYSGGAHPNQYYVAYTFGIVHGRPTAVTLQDLFRSGVDGPKTSSNLVMARLKNNPDATFVQDGTVKSVDFNGTSGAPQVGATAFVVTPRAIAFLLPPYAVGAYVNGSFVVKIPFDEFRGRLDPQGPLQPVFP